MKEGGRVTSDVSSPRLAVNEALNIHIGWQGANGVLICKSSVEGWEDNIRCIE